MCTKAPNTTIPDDVCTKSTSTNTSNQPVSNEPIPSIQYPTGYIYIEQHEAKPGKRIKLMKREQENNNHGRDIKTVNKAEDDNKTVNKCTL